MLGDMKFLDSLREFDKDHIPPATMKKIRDRYISNPDYSPGIIKNVSSACEGLCKWVLAIDVYDDVIKVCVLSVTFECNFFFFFFFLVKFANLISSSTRGLCLTDLHTLLHCWRSWAEERIFDISVRK